MAKVRVTDDSKPIAEYRPPISPEARESQMIHLAVAQAETQLRQGTAPTQVVVHYLKLAASKEKDKLEIERLEEENKLLRAKTEALQSAKEVERLYSEAIKAMRKYSGHGSAEEDEEDD